MPAKLPSLRIACPVCRGRLAVPRKLVGRQTTCPTCGHGFTVEAATDGPQPATADDCVQPANVGAEAKAAAATAHGVCQLHYDDAQRSDVMPAAKADDPPQPDGVGAEAPTRMAHRPVADLVRDGPDVAEDVRSFDEFWHTWCAAPSRGNAQGFDAVPAATADDLVQPDDVVAEAISATAAAHGVCLLHYADTGPTRKRWWLVTPWGLSTVLHALLLVGLAYWVLPLPWKPEKTVLVASFQERIDDAVDDLLASSVDAPFSDQNEEADAQLLPQLHSATLLDASATQAVPVHLDSTVSSAVAVKTDAANSLHGLSNRDLAREIAVRAVHPPLDPGTGIRWAKGAGTAVDGILNDVRRHSEEGDLLVVWLFDASLSLVDDRQHVADRLLTFFKEERKPRETKSAPLLQSVVVAFGATTGEVLAPTAYYAARTASAARDKVPIDPTGLENVMSAVQWCVARYRISRGWRGGIRIVIWTDESGDDVLLLEDTIRLCREQGVVVSVVGPTAVLGAEAGLHQYTVAKTGQRFLLPVKRGPDAAIAERVVLPYWFVDTVAPWQQDGAQVGDDAKWHGGPHREGLLSGFGPYALTRLALETGGGFTLIDRPGDGVAFAAETMRDYYPGYESLVKYREILSYYPLRGAVVQAVEQNHAFPILVAPTLEFMASRSSHYPYRSHKLYYPPLVFHAKVAETLGVERQGALAAAAVIEKALDAFGKNGMEDAYEREPSPRWRAWYDVTRGRLLAASVRYLEYQLACNSVLAGQEIGPANNWMAFRPSDQLRGGEITTDRAREAKRHLERCLSEHRGTPWAYLAQWELAHPLGLQVERGEVPPPPPSVLVPAVPVSLPRF